MTENIESRYRVTGMDCAACAAKIDTAIRRMPGVADVNVSAGRGTLSIQHKQGQPSAKEIGAVVTRLGYGSAPDYPTAAVQEGTQDSPKSKEQPWWKSSKARLTLASGLALAIAWIAALGLPKYSVFFYDAAVLVGLVPIAWRAFAAARAGTPFSIESLMTIAAIGAIIIGAAEEAAVVVFLFLVGELLEGVAASRARASIGALTALIPKTALVESEGRVVAQPADTLTPDTIIVVRPGDRIPADGVIIEGDGSIDESPVTGESVPVRKTKGASVFAGTINADAVMRVRVTAAAADNTIARVVRLVEEAQESKAPTERFIDSFSRYYTPAVVIVAAMVTVIPPALFGGQWGEWVYKGLAILLIGCPCALVISTPAAIAAALSAGARRGLLLKGGAVLEQLGKITAVAFDKTGTLTLGRPKVTDIVPFGRTREQVLNLAAALETGSNHPLAVAILEEASAANIGIATATESMAIPGKGVRGKVGTASVALLSATAANAIAPLGEKKQRMIDEMNDAGKTVSALVENDVVVGLVAVRDEPRPDAKQGITLLGELNVTSVMLTGDNRRTALAIAKTLGLSAQAELLPEDKQRIVREMQARGNLVAKVGDGINDAPALAAADVGIAMGGGTDVALETADGAVLHGRVIDIGNMVLLSRSTMRNIYQNISISLGLKAVFFVTTILGVTGLWPAILADTGATVLVTANAIRLLGWKGRSAAP